MSANCPACHAEKAPIWSTKNGYEIRRCTCCGFGFVHPMPSELVLQELYSSKSYGLGDEDDLDPAGRIECESLFPNAVLDARRMIRRGKSMLSGSTDGRTMLDVGSGSGFASRVGQEEGLRVTALEVSSSGREATKAIAGFDALPMRFEEFESEERFDIILISQVIEHVTDINRWAEKARELLTDDGVLVLAMPNLNSSVCKLLGDRDPYVVPPMHLGYFTPKASRLWLARHGFEDVSVSGVSRLGPRTIYRRLSFLPEKRALIRVVRLLQDAPFRFFGLLGFPIMLNVYARKTAR